VQLNVNVFFSMDVLLLLLLLLPPHSNSSSAEILVAVVRNSSVESYENTMDKDSLLSLES